VEAAAELLDADMVGDCQVGFDFLEFCPVGCCRPVPLLDLLKLPVCDFFSVDFPERVFQGGLEFPPGLV
jgi:hypothetical protein